MNIPKMLLTAAASLTFLSGSGSARAQGSTDFLSAIDLGVMAEVFPSFDAQWEPMDADEGSLQFKVTLSTGLVIVAAALGCDEEQACERIIYYGQFAQPSGVDRPRLLEMVNNFNFERPESSVSLFDDNSVIIQLVHRANHGSSLESVAYNFRRFDVLANDLNAILYPQSKAE